jgi:hypothetical protein
MPPDQEIAGMKKNAGKSGKWLLNFKVGIQGKF